MQSSATNVEDYIKDLHVERQEAIKTVREVILKNLPKGYEEGIGFGMISYYIPLVDYPKTYNGKPLMYAALASQKNYMSVYLMTVYGERENWFRGEFEKSGKKLNMGKSCVRFTKIEDLNLEAIGKAIALASPDKFIAFYEKFHK